MIEEYYKILGIPNTASLEEIKRAFKLKAKELHPDVNKSPNAHERFILLNEAYQYLQNLKTGKIYKDKTRGYTYSKSYGNYNQYAKDEREEVRRRAEYYARKRYQEFKKSAYYKRSVEMKGMVNQFSIFFVFVFVSAILIGGALIGTYAFYAAIFIVIMSSPNWLDMLKEAGPLKIAVLGKALLYLLKHPIVQMLLLMIVSFIIFILVILNTLVIIKWVLAAYLMVSLVLIASSIRFKFFNSRRKRFLLFFGLGPFLVNFFFLINYLTGHNPKIESYEYSLHRGYHSSDYGSIFLDGDIYDEYTGIRIFFDSEKIKTTSRITYFIEEGGLGFRVVKNYEFGYDEY